MLKEFSICKLGFILVKKTYKNIINTVIMIITIMWDFGQYAYIIVSILKANITEETVLAQCAD